MRKNGSAMSRRAGAMSRRAGIMSRRAGIMNHLSRQRRKGAISLLLCLILGSFVMIMGIFVQTARQRSGEVDLARSMTSQIDVILARYDLALYEQFGLFGVSADQIDLNAWSLMLPDWMDEAQATITIGHTVYEKERLRAQVIRQMQARAPLGWAESLLRQFDLLPAGYKSAQQDLENQEPAVDNPTPTPVPEDLWSEIRSLSEQYQELARKNFSVSQIGMITNWIIKPVLETVLEPVQKKIVESLQKAYQKTMSTLMPVWLSDLGREDTTVIPDLYDPAKVADLAGLVDQLVHVRSAGLYDRICLAEYCLGYFPSAVTTLHTDQGRTEPTTPDGRNMGDLGEARTCEVERMITGIDDADQAKTRLMAILVMIRSVIHLIANLTDQEKMSTYRTSAAVAVGVIAAVSAGTVVLDPEALAYVLCAGDAVVSGFQDMTRLQNGYKVTLWPQDKENLIGMYYQDYLRLILLLQPEDKLIAGIGDRIRAVLPRTFADQVSMQVTWQQKQYHLSGGYDLRLGETG